ASSTDRSRRSSTTCSAVAEAPRLPGRSLAEYAPRPSTQQPLPGPRMFFRAQNLGPLRDAEVDLSKDMIVLAGPNNSGKTYLAWSVYGLHRSASMPPALSPLLDPWVQKLMESPDHRIDLSEVFAQLGADLLGHIAAEFRSRLHLCFATESERFANAE